MSAERIARELGGHKSGAGWMARCPAHEDRVPSLSISDAPDGKILVHCRRV
jgi:putative DNA primase/helicase